MSSSHTPLVRIAAGLLLVAAVTASSAALASETYPERLQSALDMPCTPPCTVCHRDSNGGMGTATQPFGAAMTNAELTLKAPDGIPLALAVLASKSIDSDGDGVTDTEELREGSNPNAAGESVLCATYGCGAHIVPEAPSRSASKGPGAWFLLALATLAVAFRRRRGPVKVR